MYGYYSEPPAIHFGYSLLYYKSWLSFINNDSHEPSDENAMSLHYRELS